MIGLQYFRCGGLLSNIYVCVCVGGGGGWGGGGAWAVIFRAGDVIGLQYLRAGA